MDVMEKLIEILKQAPFEGKVLDEWWWEEKIKRIADHLISNGVTVQENVEISDELLKQLKNAPITICKEEPSTETVQEWISVKDNLPEAGRYVVCIAKRNPFSRFMPMVARIEKNGWVNPITEQYISEVTNWMPIPQPPKGE